MWRAGTSQGASLACPKCQRKFPAQEVAFLCPEPRCKAREHPLEGQGEQWEGKPLFRPARYNYTVPCPYSPHNAYLKICPHCWEQLPVATGRSSTIAVVGASSSGKTCFTTALIRQIRKELSRETAYEMSLEWEDQAGLAYFREQERTIFSDGMLPPPTQKESPIESLQITVRFPVRGLKRRMLKGSQGAISLVFYDPAGEHFESLDEVYYLHYLTTAEAIILMVDPFASEEYQAHLRRQGHDNPFAGRRVTGAADALSAFVMTMRREMNQHDGKLKKQLAVVLTKCDEPGMFDPDHRQHEDRYPVQGSNYDPTLAEEISKMVAQHMEEELGMSEVVALARRSFRDVSFFAASALGAPPPLKKVINDFGDAEWRQEEPMRSPRPRRVEEPLLWILHRWGYI